MLHPEQSQLIDFFPQTTHLENLALLKRVVLRSAANCSPGLADLLVHRSHLLVRQVSACRGSGAGRPDWLFQPPAVPLKSIDEGHSFQQGLAGFANALGQITGGNRTFHHNSEVPFTGRNGGKRFEGRRPAIGTGAASSNRCRSSSNRCGFRQILLGSQFGMQLSEATEGASLQNQSGERPDAGGDHR